MSRVRSRRWMLTVAAVLAVVAGACSPDWATWANGPERHGENTSESTIGAGTVGQLQHKWSVDLGAYINSAPIIANVNVNGTPTDVVFVGNEHGVLFAVTTAGQIIWFRYLGANTRTDCLSTPDGVHGVSAAVQYDAARNLVYAADGNGKVWALNPATGAVANGWPVPYTFDGATEIVESAPTLMGNHLYVETASYCDRGNYYGRIIDINPDTHSIAHTWFVNGGGTTQGALGGSVWGWGGVSVDPANGDVYAATGNATTPPENQHYSDAIVRLSANLQLKQFHTPGVVIGDDDFGSTPVLFQKSGCPPQLVAEQKNGSVYLYDRDTIGNGYRQRFTFSQANLIGVPAWSTQTQMIYIVNPKGLTNGVYIPGLAAFRIDGNCRLASVWQAPASVSVGSTPTVANGVVYFTGGFRGTVHAVNAVTGVELWNSGTSVTGPILASPVVFKGQLFAVGYDHRLHAWGL